MEEGQKYLIASFVVNFDYLPEFKEEVRLEYVDRKESIKSLEVSNFQVEIEEMERALNNFEKNGVTIHNEVGTQQYVTGQKKEIWSKELEKGRYIMRICGVYTNGSGNISSDNVKF